MRIQLLEKRVADVIALDDVGGEFFAGDDGSVRYRHPDDANVWFVNTDEPSFQKCVAAFTQYCDDVLKVDGEAAVVEKLALVLISGEAQEDGLFCYWGNILAQCRDGLL